MDLLERLTSHQTIKTDKEIGSILDKIVLTLEGYNEINLRGNLNKIPLLVSLKSKANGEVYCEVKSYGMEKVEPDFLPVLQRILENLGVNRKKLVTDIGNDFYTVPYIDDQLRDLHNFLSSVEEIEIK